LSRAGRLANWPSTDPLLLGAYAWLLTVASPSFRLGVSALSRGLCLLALVLLVLGWLAMVRFPHLADYLTFGGFCGASVATLISLGHGTLATGFTAVKLVLGAIIWCLFSISWIRTRHLAISSLNVQLVPMVNLASPERREPRVPKAVILGAALASLVIVAWYGLPSGDGHGSLIIGLIVVAALKITSSACTMASRFEQWRLMRPNRPRDVRR
jgi:hypothetical protein